ncbi:hypothetical protein ACFL6E_06025 [Candidatus Neomarinimicrobiota bacterium]
MEVQSVDETGMVRYRYGGWGTGSDALDLAIALYSSENSIFVLDQGRSSIVRLDLQLNRVSNTQLPLDIEPIGFIRDSHRQYWIIVEGRPGLHVFDDHGALLTVIGDQTSGDDGILAPLLIASYGGRLAVWDHHRQSVCVLSEAGVVERWLQIDEAANPIDLAFAGDTVYILTNAGIIAVALETGERRFQKMDLPRIALFQMNGQLFTVDSEGTISAFTAKL